jgi:hypothetical protein
MAIDPITGPVPPEEFRRLVDAPHGEAVKAIRKYDPTYGLKDGETIKWIVTYEREVTQVGTITVDASSEDEAEKLADEILENDEERFAWESTDSFADNYELISVEPKR